MKRKITTSALSRMKQYKTADTSRVRNPKSAQDIIEIVAIDEKGIFQVGKTKYSKTYYFTDTNYTNEPMETQIQILEKLCVFSNSMNVPFKITINNKNRDMQSLRDNIMLKQQPDEFNEKRKNVNKAIEKRIIDGKQGIEKEMYLTVTCDRNNYEETRAYFNMIESQINKMFSDMGSVIDVLDAEDRLKIVHDLYRLGKESEYTYNFDAATYRASDFKNDICPNYIKFKPNYIETEDYVARAIYIRSYPTELLSDRFITEVMDLPIRMMCTIDVVPIPNDITNKALHELYLNVEDKIRKQQKVRNKNKDFSSDISYTVLEEKKEITNMIDDLHQKDQQMFYIGVNILVIADDLKQLDDNVESVMTVGRSHSVTFDIAKLKQKEALNTILPIGVRQVETMRSLVTRSVAAFVPFNVQELIIKDGVNYGVNQISKNIVVGNRTKLTNGSGFVFGVPGSGKSVFIKDELWQVFLRGNEDIIIIDPMNEYFNEVSELKGAIIDVSVETKTNINPLDYSGISDIKTIPAIKFEFMLAICEQCKGSALTAKERTIIDRCVKYIYRNVLLDTDIDEVVTLINFYEELKRQPEPEAMDLAIVMELFVSGSLNIFSKTTNVDMNNRITCYGLKNLGKGMAPLGILVMLESITNRIAYNYSRGIPTRLYMDELHVLIGEDKGLSAKYCFNTWKEVRKLGCIPTGITQNVQDCLQNYEARTMLSNSEFVVLFHQSNNDLEDLANVIGITNSQLKYLTTAKQGWGLMKHGGVIIPFNDELSKNDDRYNIFNTNFYEKNNIN